MFELISEDSKLSYLIQRANKLGAKGQKVVGLILPSSATQNILDTIFITECPKNITASETNWYDE